MAEMCPMELPGQLIAELCPLDPLGAAAAFPWLLCVHRSQVLSPASRGVCRHAAPHQTLSLCPAQPCSGDLLAGTLVHSFSLCVPVALCSAQGSAGSNTKDLVSCAGRKTKSEMSKKMVLPSFRRQQRISY